MSDKMTIVGKDGSPRYVVEDTKVTDVIHKHKFMRGRCVTCKKTRIQLKEIEDARRN